MNKLKSVYHGEHGVRALKELVRSYLTINKDVARVMTRVKALYRSWAIPCTGKQVYLAGGIQDCDRDAFLVNVEADILRAIHVGRSFP